MIFAVLLILINKKKMDDNRICERSAKCPIYTGVLESKGVLISTFKNLYCEKGKEVYQTCKRYRVADIAGSCPPDILPNSRLTVEEIIKKMEQNK